LICLNCPLRASRNPVAPEPVAAALLRVWFHLQAPPPRARRPATISFGKRADADVRPVAMTAKSVRGYKLPPSSLLYRSDEIAVVREQALRDEARTLVQNAAEFGVDGQVTQINPGPVVTTSSSAPTLASNTPA